jgi:hypothetical protein
MNERSRHHARHGQISHRIYSYSIVLRAMRVNNPLAKLRSGVSTLCYLSFVTTNIRSELLKMTNFSCRKSTSSSSQPASRGGRPADRLRIPAQNEAHLGAPRGDST